MEPRSTVDTERPQVRTSRLRTRSMTLFLALLVVAIFVIPVAAPTLGDGGRVVGMARLLSDGVCNAYLVDVWTASSHRREGIATAMIRRLLDEVPGQHVGLQTDDDAQAFYASLGFGPQPEFWSTVVGGWLENDANR